MESLTTDGRTFEAFCTDPALWGEGAYLDFSLVTVNGVRLEEHAETVRDDDRVTVYDGLYMHPRRPAPLADVFRAWRTGRVSAD